MVEPENIIHKGMLESSKHLNTQSRYGLGRHRTYESGNLPHLPEGMWVVGPHGLANRIEPGKIKAVACGVSLRVFRVAVLDGEGKTIDFTQLLSKGMMDANGEPIGEYGAEKGQMGKPPYKAAMEHAKRGLAAPQAVFIINAFRIAHRLGKPLEVYLPSFEYRPWADYFGRRLGVDGNALLDSHLDTLKMQIRRIGKKLFPEVPIKITDTDHIGGEELPPIRGHWTRYAVKEKGIGKKAAEFAENDDAASSHAFKYIRKKHGLILVEQHATGIISDSKPYNSNNDGLHMVVSSAPFVYETEELERVSKLREKEKYRDKIQADFENGADGHPYEIYLGKPRLGELWNPGNKVYEAYRRALKGVEGFEKARSLPAIINALSRLVTE
ncbi:MAG: hypothetical protein ABIG96_02745 [Candidatus Micrarchaeota archaeon]